MPEITDAALQEMLNHLPKESRKSLAHIISGKITHQVVCMGQDTHRLVTRPVLDEDRQPVLDADNSPVTHEVQELVRKGCKGTVIAYFYVDGTDDAGRPAYRVEPIVNEDKSMRLRAVRRRLDGEYGFECSCSNDSRLAVQEAGHITYDGLPPTRTGLESIYRALQNNPSSYPEIDGVKEVDGFRIERVKA